MNRCWLVTHMATNDPYSGAIGEGWNDEWRVFESREKAQEFYDECVEGGAYSVSLCAVVQSTDYEPHELFREDN